MMKETIKQRLQKLGIYDHLKYSVLFRIYQRLLKPLVIKAEKKEVAFYRSFLPYSTLIFDIGAHDGHKTAAFLSIARKIVSVEPDTTNFKLLQVRFRYKKKRVFSENSAVSDIQETRSFHIHHDASAFNTLSDNWREVLEKDNLEKWNEKIIFSKSRMVSTITLDQLIMKYGIPGFIKIDVEGWEEKVLKGLTQKVPFLSFEALLPQGKEQLDHCLNLIEQLDSLAGFNIALHEELQLPSFVNLCVLKDWLQQNTITHLEIIVRMNTATSH